MSNPGLVRRLKNALRSMWDSLWTSQDSTVVKTGGASPWWIKTDLLVPGAVVISGGAGKDVSFEKELAELYGCRVFVFDPSPTGLETMSRPENQHPLISFHPLGLATTEGVVKFNLPQNPSEGSYSLATGAAAHGAAKFGCTTVSAFARAHNLVHIDVLKPTVSEFVTSR